MPRASGTCNSGAPISGAGVSGAESAGGQEHGGLFFIRAKQVETGLEGQGVVSGRLHSAQAGFFIVKFGKQASQSRGFSQMGTGALRARAIGQIAQDAAFAGQGRRFEGVFQHAFVQISAGDGALAPHFLRQGPGEKFAPAGFVFIKEEIAAAGFQIKQQCGLFFWRKRCERPAQGRREHWPVPPVFPLRGARLFGGRPAGRRGIVRRAAQQPHAFPQIKAEPQPAAFSLFRIRNALLPR